jgi:hypothetical protein
MKKTNKAADSKNKPGARANNYASNEGPADESGRNRNEDSRKALTDGFSVMRPDSSKVEVSKVVNSNIVYPKDITEPKAKVNLPAKALLALEKQGIDVTQEVKS